ncbi:hypothetical protein BX616_011109 [Lobosporangium transversale]|uniref:Uncharacterized protein n=1 Tax=Lobosporangium transversale TaxID=64571 RepID=A0A1Y2G9V8_9FUNG|nr:hypothetical protein BCR41DRAFT_374685 [Lobosporangium transversale]KAF9909603.1 hypothetical protein BX616_011109 [Lobosporangium transversale]ORZ05012.1 hypothetical protein BCR41DRAFT_374685 [Lobosporangium transversale]|eukprot:XP_021876876.1 hypothetical protein BCR41DRAFT_374685 [Lobosporangium transversale]
MPRKFPITSRNLDVVFNDAEQDLQIEPDHFLPLPPQAPPHLAQPGAQAPGTAGNDLEGEDDGVAVPFQPLVFTMETEVVDNTRDDDLQIVLQLPSPSVPHSSLPPRPLPPSHDHSNV